jgi:hypothetical protein
MFDTCFLEGILFLQRIPLQADIPVLREPAEPPNAQQIRLLDAALAR